MLLRPKKLNFISKTFFLFLLFFHGVGAFGQQSNRVKIDGVASVVGDFVILDSDIDKTIMEMESQGISTKSISRCELLGKLMEDKLYAHHAIQDSLEVSDQEIYDYVDQSIEYFIEQLGSMEKVLEFYNKPDQMSFREELFEINKIQKLASMMQEEIVSNVEVTPEEVRLFFESIPKIDLPVFGTELEIAQIVLAPKVSKDEEERIINQLKNMRSDVLEKGLSFSSKAILYSQDPGSRSKGGKYTLYRKRPRMAKEFRDVAFSLQEGEISEPFKTDFGWHILQVEKIRGQEIDIRHILLIPKIDEQQLRESKELLEQLRQRIVDNEISFEEAAFQFSTEKETRLNGGVLINPATGDTRFELTKIDPVLYNQIRYLEDNEISKPLLEEEQSGAQKYKILKVTNRFEEHTADFLKDYIKIKELALKDKKLKMIQKWIAQKIEETYVNVNKDSRYCSFTNNWLKNND
ncbi:MAG: peptidylprolyl isomerase [Bacteroidetes bacterium]|nr:peptidylprolyl isomerase [Bacteroidota bacterium]MDA0938385.1 peptidylprolyl isomerase [Bacteroidota bacterium]MDA1344892.1 peptidylprolyl isomerase [Bacteroidota bacterium]